ncbi:MAG: zinc ribbon domain-containing protein [Oscillospiraceae bacterium]
MNCPKCGAVVPDGTEFCTTCGEKLAVSDSAEISANPAHLEAAPVKPEKKKKERPNISEEELTKPLGIFRFFGMLFLLGIPVLNIVMLFRWAFGWGVNKNKRDFARGALLYFLVMLALIVFTWIVWPELFTWISSMINKIAAWKFLTK